MSLEYIKKLKRDLHYYLRRKSLKKYRKVIEQEMHAGSMVFYDQHATRLRGLLLNDFLLSGQTFPRVNNFCINEKEAKQEIDVVVSSINEKGYHVVENFVSSEICKRITEYSEITPSFPRPLDADAGAIRQESIFRKPYLSARYDFSPDLKKIFNNKDLQNILVNDYAFKVAERYLGGSPYLDPVELWWTVPYPKRDDAWAEEYHFDYDTVRWLKFFINFEDISYENGPHCFIEGSHKDNGIPSDFRKFGYARLSDDDVFKCYDKSSEKIFTVKAGSLLIEDTRGLHKGLTPTSGRRLIFQFQLSKYLFLDKSTLEKRVKPEFEMSESFLYKLRSNPEFFERYFI